MCSLPSLLMSLLVPHLCNTSLEPHTKPFTKNTLHPVPYSLSPYCFLLPATHFNTNPPTHSPIAPSSSALPLTIKKYLYNFKWHLSAAQRKRKRGKWKSSEGVFSSLLFSHPSYCQTLKSVSLTFFNSMFFISSEWLAGTHFDSSTETREISLLPLSPSLIWWA